MRLSLSLYTSLPLCLAITLSGCSAAPIDSSGAALADADTNKPRAQSWSCPAEPGAAPSGKLVATRVEEANSTREEPGLFEGPVWIDDALYFSDFTFAARFPSRIQRLGPDGTVTTVIDDSGSNGLAVDREGNILAAAHAHKAISRYHPHTGHQKVVIDEFNSDPFNSPNDLTVSRSGVIYFTDPDFQRSAAPGGQPLTRVYQYDERGVKVIDESLTNPNGVSLSPDESTLYVAGGDVLRAYPIVAGEVGESTDIAELTHPDGMAIDCLGNIYATEHSKQRLRVFSPDGVELATIKVDANITNAAFGGVDRKTLYITGAGAVWELDLDVAGMPY